jgi:hypothetical protein
VAGFVMGGTMAGCLGRGRHDRQLGPEPMGAGRSRSSRAAAAAANVPPWRWLRSWPPSGPGSTAALGCVKRRHALAWRGLTGVRGQPGSLSKGSGRFAGLQVLQRCNPLNPPRTLPCPAALRHSLHVRTISDPAVPARRPLRTHPLEAEGALAQLAGGAGQAAAKRGDGALGGAGDLVDLLNGGLARTSGWAGGMRGSAWVCGTEE